MLKKKALSPSLNNEESKTLCLQPIVENNEIKFEEYTVPAVVKLPYLCHHQLLASDAEFPRKASGLVPKSATKCGIWVILAERPWYFPAV